MDRMHDWTLIGVNLDWRSARATLTLEDTAAAKRMLAAEQVRLLEIPRESEWGPSVSVNEALEEPGPDGTGVLLRIEMQSGDVIRIWAATVAVV